MKNTVISVSALLALLFSAAGCGRRESLDSIHRELLQKLESDQTVDIAWDAEQKRFMSLPKAEQATFENSFRGKKVRINLKIKEYKTADMAFFQKAFDRYDYKTKEQFNFNNLMVVIGNGPTRNGIETSFVVFLPNRYLFDFEKQQTIVVEGLVDKVSFTFYNCHALIYPAKLVSK